MLLSLLHAELVSASGGKEIPKQVRDDGCAAVLYGESCFLKHIVVC